jgi:undecaprenyl-diphosphatase
MARGQPGARLKALVLGGAILLTILVGFSRVYLGVHWPTDVLAGWCFGAAWAALWWLVLRRVKQA